MGDLLQLKSLQIAGFKSFARPVELEFPSGVTAFVGANGSGKSNIVDAIRWCLGEQNARDLRGQRAEDVIHAGKRRVLGSAEVTLAFEGECEAESDIQIARRLMRSGESDYLINGSRRRLRDVQSALSGLGMDHPRFVVVTQGMTDFLLSATAAERRSLLEQAAGLSSYRQRRDDASGKLTSAEQNMLTADIVLTELEPRIRALQRQVRAIEARDELVAKLQARQTIWYLARRRENRTALEEMDRLVATAEADRRAAQNRLDALEREAERSLEREREWQRRIEVSSAALHLAQRELDANAHRIGTVKVHITDAERARDGIRRRLSELAGEVQRARERREQAEAGFQQACVEAEKAREAETSARERLEHRQVQLRNCAHLADEAREESARRAEAASALAGKRRRLELELEELELRLTRLSTSEREMKTALHEVRGAVERARAGERSNRDRLGLAARRLERQMGLVQAAEERSRRGQGLQEVVSADVRVARSRRDVLQRNYLALERQLAGTALDRLDVVPGAERAIAVALGDWGSGFAPTGRHLDGFRSWRASLEDVFPPDAVWADAVARCDSPVPALLVGTIVVDSLPEAEQLWEALASRPAHRIGSPPIQIATRDGSLVSADGIRTETEDDNGARFLALRSELALAERETGRLERHERRLNRVCGDLSMRLEELQSDTNRYEGDADQARKELARAEVESHSLQARSDRLEEDLGEAARAISGSKVRRDDLVKALADITAQLDRLTAGAAQARERARDADTAVGQARTEVERARQAVADVSGDVAILARRAQAQEELARAADLEETRLRAEPARLEAELLATEANLERFGEELADLRRAAAEFASEAAEREKHLAAVRVDRPKSAELGSELRSAREISDRALTRHERAVARRDEIRAAGERLEHEIRQEMGSTALEGPGEPDDVDIPAEDEIRRLRARAAQYADYDPSILAEYQELSERREYLTSQISDLRATADGLREIMSVADAEMRTRFAEALARVGEEFNRVFTGMVRGGQAGLEQTEDGGIEVRAALPGKRTRSIASFSGGERALVASALLIGVLSIRPAPFCVLDEVDAALDEANVDRYLQALSDLGQRMQILVVTHNRATMAAATALYGLTMDAEGASSLLSLRLDQYDAVS